MATKSILTNYLKAVTKVATAGDAREESFYPCLKELFEAYAKQAGVRNIHVTVNPKKTEAGNPDFRIWNGETKIFGYIEAKHLTTKNLEAIQTTEQLQRYLTTFPNLLLTNFVEFFLFRNGELVDRVSIAEPGLILKLGTKPPVKNEKEFFDLLDKYFSFSLPKSFTAESLAKELARRTRFLRDVVSDELEEENRSGHGGLLGFYEAFHTYLIGRITHEEFSDLYAQTVTYGLFAARTRAKDEFSRALAFSFIPKTLGILKDIFQFISLGSLPTQLEWIVDDISEVLSVANTNKLLEKYYKEGKGGDPIVHFYETFLAEYDPGERERRGVYYTPEPVVSYIVTSLNSLLKEKFDRTEGLASDGLTLLDPGAGTMTFIAKACQVAVREFETKYGSGNTQGFIQQHILKNFFAFELMMAPYAVGHLKMSFFLEELGHKLGDEDRFKFYLTNTLEMEALEQTEIPGMASLAQESRLAGEVKKHQPILVILGNPPYSGHSSNKGKEISELIDDYKIVDGKPLGEKNPKWLQDDYVKFIRFAQWKIDQVGHGLIGLITNHSYLDNPTFRGMRQSLMKTFDEIYVLDLHGNSLKKEKAPDGSKDENVFDIRAGVAIVFLIKRKGKKSGKVFHAELFGVRHEKYDWLSKNQFKTTQWKEIKPQSEHYMFVPRDEKILKQYNRHLKVTDIFPKNSVGIVTSRDHFVLDFDKEALKQRIRIFRDPKMPDEIVREALNLKDNRDWKMPEKRKKIQADKEWEKKIVKCLYRPFDKRWIFYHYDAIDFGREEIMRHMMEENLGLCIGRQWGAIGSKIYDIVCMSNHIVDFNFYRRGGELIFPLYIYPDKSKKDLFSHLEENSKRTANINPELLDTLKNHYEKRRSPEKIFYYVYAVLYSETYREKYKEFLKSDFPRVPFTSDKVLFDSLAKLGKKLTDLHLLKGVSSPSAKFHGSGDSRVARSKKEFFYDPETKRVHINANQYFDSVSQDVWDYKIGGYQVLDKWLKDRKERVLTLEEIKDYCRIVTALKKTIEVQSQIDSLYPNVEDDFIQMS